MAQRPPPSGERWRIMMPSKKKSTTTRQRQLPLMLNQVQAAALAHGETRATAVVVLARLLLEAAGQKQENHDESE